MSPENPYLSVAVCFLDLVGCFTIVCLMLETTKHASVSAFFHGDKQGAWAMTRRLIYAAVATALFAKCLLILDGQIQVHTLDSIIWITILFAIIFFPAVRAAGVVDQDRWVGFHHDKKEDEGSRIA